MCRSEAVVHRCGCTEEQVTKRCRHAKNAFDEQQRKRYFDWGFMKRKRQSSFASDYTKDGYCRNVDKSYFPSSSLCHTHETRYDGTQTYSRTNPLLHANREDGLVFVEMDAYDGSGKMLPRNHVPQAPQPIYHPQQTLPRSTASSRGTAPTTYSYSSEHTSRSRTKSKKDSQSRRDREAEAQNKRILKDAERLHRERGNSRFQNSKSVEDIRRRAITKSREKQWQQEPPPVPTIPNTHESWSLHHSLIPESLVPGPLNIVKTQRDPLPETAPLTAFPPSYPSYPTPRRRIHPTGPTSSRDTYPTPPTAYSNLSSPPPTPPRARPRIVGSHPSAQDQSFGSAQDENAHLVASKRTTVLDTITRGAATHPRVARHHPDYVSRSRTRGESSSSSSYYYYEQGASSQYGRSGGASYGCSTDAPPSRERCNDWR